MRSASLLFLLLITFCTTAEATSDSLQIEIEIKVVTDSTVTILWVNSDIMSAYTRIKDTDVWKGASTLNVDYQSVYWSLLAFIAAHSEKCIDVNTLRFKPGKTNCEITIEQWDDHAIGILATNTAIFLSQIEDENQLFFPWLTYNYPYSVRSDQMKQAVLFGNRSVTIFISPITRD